MIKVLILEDNLEVLRSIFDILIEIEAETGRLAVTVFSEARKAEKFLKTESDFDLVLLDYYAIDGNFHQAVFENKIKSEKIISISSLEEKNLEAENKGVLRSVQKNFADLDKFEEELRGEILKILK